MLVIAASSVWRVVRASAIVLVLGSALASRASGEPPVTTAPAVHFGDEWRYNDGIVSRVWLDREGRPALRRGHGIPPMEFPLFVGQQWTSRDDHGTVTTQRGEVTAHGVRVPRLDLVDVFHEHVFEVLAVEPVTTPVGSLQAYRIMWVRVTGGREPSVAVTLIWFSPEVKAVVKRSALTPTAPRPDLVLQEYRLTGDTGR